MDYRVPFDFARGVAARAISGALAILNRALAIFRRSRTFRYRVFLIAAAVYLSLGGLLAVPIYAFSLDNEFTRFAERLFPYPAAIVDAGIVSLQALHKQEGFVEQFVARTGQTLPEQSPRQRVLDQLIENKLVAKAAARRGFHLPLREVDASYQKVISKNGGEQKVKKVLKNLYNMSLADFKSLVRAQLLKDKVRDDLLVRVKPRHILVSDEARAKEVLEKALKGDNWDELAKQFSEDTASRDQGGSLGLVGRGALAKPFEEVVFTLEPGKIHPELVKTDFGFHIVRSDERNQGKIDKSYDQFLMELKQMTRIVKLAR